MTEILRAAVGVFATLAPVGLTAASSRSSMPRWVTPEPWLTWAPEPETMNPETVG